MRSPGSRSSQSRPLAALWSFPLVGALACAPTGCKGKEEAKATPTAETSPKPAEKIPDDFVVNDFMPEGAGKRPANPVAASEGDGGQAPAGTEGDAAPAKAVQLLEPGAEPRATRRYGFTAGRTETLRVTVRVSATQEGAPPGVGDQPPMKLTLAVKPTGKPANGEQELAVTLSKAELVLPPGVDKAMAARIAEPLKALSGLQGTLRVGDRGHVAPLEIQGNPPSPDAGEVLMLVEQALRSLVVPFPEEAIGRGAKWQENGVGSEQGLATTTTSTYTLTDVAPDAQVISVATTRTAAPQAFRDPRAPRGTTIALDSGGKSTVRVRLDRLGAKATTEVTTNLTIKPPADGAPAGRAPPSMTQKVVVTQDIDNGS